MRECCLVLAFCIWIMLSPLFAQPSQARAEGDLFLKEQSSPLEIVQQGQSSLVFKNISAKIIAQWSEACLIREKLGYKILKIFPIYDHPEVMPGSTTYDAIATYVTPALICRRESGVIVIWDVDFADGSTWRSRWINQRLKR
jgi:hypothetical protein